MAEYQVARGRAPPPAPMGDVASVHSDTGQLTVVTPEWDAFNSTLNVSLSCFTEAVRGDRDWSDLEKCVEYTLSFFSLHNLRLYAFPLRLRFPWDDEPSANATADATAAAAAAAAAIGAAPAASAMHTDPDHHHHHDDGYYYATGIEVLYVFFFLAIVLLICGAVAGDAYLGDADEWEWRVCDGRYVRVAVAEAQATPPPPPPPPPPRARRVSV